MKRLIVMMKLVKILVLLHLACFTCGADHSNEGSEPFRAGSHLRLVGKNTWEGFGKACALL